ncbi:hypothetical protein [Marinobacter halophilus]
MFGRTARDTATNSSDIDELVHQEKHDKSRGRDHR